MFDERFNVINEPFKTLFCPSDKTDFEMPLGWKNLKKLLLLRKEVRQVVNKLNQKLLFENRQYKDCMWFFEEMSMLRDDVNEWQCVEVRDKTFKLMSHMLRLVSTSMESAEETGFVDNIPLLMIKLRMKSGRI